MTLVRAVKRCEHMNIAVVGAGAMGSLFGGLLAESGENVTLVDIWKEHVEAINEKGLKTTGINGERMVKVRATTNHFEVGIVDLILLFVKSYDTVQASENSLPIVGDETVFLSLQNGLGNINKIAGVVGGNRVVRGVTAHGSTVLGPGEILHAGKGLTLIGELNGSTT
jgi:2-dehydropantoate 2-reductase